MRYAIVALSLAIAARAQTRDDIPECAISCLEDGIESETQCEIDDDACACENIEAIQSAATGCVVSNCGVDTAVGEVLPAVEALCQAVGDGDDGEDDGSEEPETPEEPEDPVETEEPEMPEEPDMPEEPEHPEKPDDECSTVHPSHAPTNGTGPEPTHAPEPVPEPTHEPTPVPTAGAALIGSMGGLALAGIAALAL